MRPPVRLKPGMWIGFEEQRHQVTGFVDGMVRLRSEAGVAQLILAGELLGHASFRPQVDNPAEPDPGTAEPDPSALLDGLSKARRTELRRMQAHLLEMTTGFRSGEAASAMAGEPHALYRAKISCHGADLPMEGSGHAARRYSLITPPSTLRRRIGA
jgi:putative transposase